MSVPRNGHGHWETGVLGLEERHVKRIRVDWEDSPPAAIAEERLRDIMKALRLGFDEMQQQQWLEQFDDEPEVSLGPGF